MSKKKPASAKEATTQINENLLFTQISKIIENRKFRAITHANQEVTIMFWEVGQQINSVVLDSKRAEYGKQIVSTLSTQLVEKYGKTFEIRNLRRMVQFAEYFPDKKTMLPLAALLTWSHFVELLPVKSDEARLFYAQDVANRQLGIRELRHQISRKAYERREIANTQLSENSKIPFNVFKDPYLLDMFGLKENFYEADLEKAILIELEAFLLEFGHGFTFVERQKRMIIDNEDIVLDLLFYHRILKRLVAVELKLGVFKAAYKGQMELYLKWLDRYERKDGEESPIGIILCATANREKVELLEMDKAGIAVAEYWTHLPPKAKFESKIKEIMIEAKERLERRKSFPKSGSKKQLEYFYETKDDDE
jgi:predicted nuclease of restriction endonuclease-like (RecB) superfamily